MAVESVELRLVREEMGVVELVFGVDQ